MEKIVTCTGCQKTFKVSGPHSRMKEVPQGVTCPFWGESNEVMWPMDTGWFTTIPKKQASKQRFRTACPTTSDACLANKQVLVLLYCESCGLTCPTRRENVGPPLRVSWRNIACTSAVASKGATQEHLWPQVYKDIVNRFG